jgi:hypothetical protein
VAVSVRRLIAAGHGPDCSDDRLDGASHSRDIESFPVLYGSI